MVTIGPMIREKRKELGLSQDQLAEKIGKTAGYVGQLEREQSSPSYPTFCRTMPPGLLSPISAPMTAPPKNARAEWKLRAYPHRMSRLRHTADRNSVPTMSSTARSRVCLTGVPALDQPPPESKKKIPTGNFGQSLEYWQRRRSSLSCCS